MRPKATLDRLLDVLYRSANEPARIADFLVEISYATRSHAASVCAHDRSGIGGPLLDWSGIPAEAATTYAARYANENIWIKNTLPQQMSGEVIVTDDWVSKTNLHRSLYWREFLQLIDVDHCIAICCDGDGDSTYALNLVRSQRLGHYQGDDVALMRLLSPHWVNLCKIQIALGVHARRGTAAEAALVGAALGLYFLGADGRVAWMNRCAERLVQRADLVLLRRGYLVGRSPEGCRRLKLAVESVQSRRLDGKQAAHIALRDTTGAIVAFATVRSLGPSRSVFGTGPHANTLVCIRDLLASDPHDLTATLIELFSMTPAEASLAIALYETRDLEAATAMLAVGRETARTRLKLIFDKTGVHSQTSLVALVSALAQTLTCA